MQVIVRQIAESDCQHAIFLLRVHGRSGVGVDYCFFLVGVLFLLSSLCFVFFLVDDLHQHCEIQRQLGLDGVIVMVSLFGEVSLVEKFRGIILQWNLILACVFFFGIVLFRLLSHVLALGAKVVLGRQVWLVHEMLGQHKGDEIVKNAVFAGLQQVVDEEQAFVVFSAARKETGHQEQVVRVVGPQLERSEDGLLGFGEVLPFETEGGILHPQSEVGLVGLQHLAEVALGQVQMTQGLVLLGEFEESLVTGLLRELFQQNVPLANALFHAQHDV